MLELIGNYLPLGVTVAVSPMVLVGLIVVLTSAKGATGGIAFTAGWFMGIFIPVAIVVAIGQETGADQDTPQAQNGLQIGGLILAGLMLWLSYRSFAGRPAPGQEAKPPGWLAALDQMSLAKIFGVGMALIFLNLKNLPIMAQAAALISLSELSATQKFIGVLVFTLLGTITGVIIVGIALFAKHADQILGRSRHWLIQHNATVMGTLFGFLGIQQLGKALGG